MKKVILGISLLFLVAAPTTTFGQETKAGISKKQRVEMTPEQKAQKSTDKMAKALELDENQKKEMYAINLKHAQERAKLQAERRALKAKLEAERNTHSQKIDEMLTEEQRTKLAEIKTKKEQQRKERREQMRTKE